MLNTRGTPNLLTIDFLILLLGAVISNGQWELWLVIPDWFAWILVVTFTDNINNCDEKDKSSFWSGCNVDFALSVGCNDFALSVVMIILFYKIK